MRRYPSIAWHEFLPAGAALAAFLLGLAGGLASPARLAPPLAIAVLYPLWLAASHRPAHLERTGLLRQFLPPILLVPMYFILSGALQPGAPDQQAGSPPPFFPFLLAAVTVYLYAVLIGAHLRNLTKFRRLSLGLQATFYGTLLLSAPLPFPVMSGCSTLLITLMTFLLFYDLLYRQSSLIASFLLLAVLTIVTGLSVPFSPATEAITIMLPALVLAVLKVTGFPRR